MQISIGDGDSFSEPPALSDPTAKAADRGESRSLPKRTLVVLADGTSNAYGGVPTNIWRLYQTLDSTGWKGQRARYFPGVGTSSNRVIRTLDAATGLGVPFNVRKAYRFLCWNYEPGDRIFLFGFSRGAFTVRTLAGMIASQGLMPRVIGGRAVSNEEMRRNARGAWRAYRAATAPLRDKEGRLKMSPAVSLARLIVAGVTRLYRLAMGYQQHEAVLQEPSRLRPAPDGGSDGVSVAFMGLFDTVEAYGVPVEELRNAVNWWVWPLKFRNRRCANVVAQVRHALSLDDERLTFHPIRCEKSHDTQDIREVWFAGCHSDIGGGYPDDVLAMEALFWMAGEAEAAGLILDRPALDAMIGRRNPAALVHDSRSGLASFYRYSPRDIAVDPGLAPEPIIHASVLGKIAEDSDGYAPAALTGRFRFDARDAPQDIDNGAAAALATLRLLSDRGITVVLVTLALFPWLIGPLSQRVREPFVCASCAPGWLLDLIPAFLHPHATAFLVHPGWSLGLAAVLIALMRASGGLRSAVEDQSRAVWSEMSREAAGTYMPGKVTLRAVAFGLWLRRRRWLGRTAHRIAAYLVPILFVALSVLVLHGIIRDVLGG